MNNRFGDLRIKRLGFNSWEVYQYGYNDQDRLAWVPLMHETNYNRLMERVSLWYNRLPGGETDYMYYREKEGLDQ